MRAESVEVKLANELIAPTGVADWVLLEEAGESRQEPLGGEGRAGGEHHGAGPCRRSDALDRLLRRLYGLSELEYFAEGGAAGARVVLVSGPVLLPTPAGVAGSSVRSPGS